MHIERQTIREAPRPPLLQGTKDDPTRPPAPKEPVLAVQNVQGNILAGFNKDHQTLLFLKIQNVADFRRWLGELIPFVATTSEVLTFNWLFKEIRRRRNAEARTVQATWINIALSFSALKSLSGDGTTLQEMAREFPDYKEWTEPALLAADAFQDQAFKEGLQARSVALGDPRDAQGGENPEDIEGNRHNWVIGGPGNEADAVVIVASDSFAELSAEVNRIEESIYSGRTLESKHANSGVTILHKQQGATLPPPLTGHEHFGFLDGVSQPGLRGRVSENPSDLLTPRQNPADPDQGKPGQDLLWPGEFVFGYPGQDPEAKEVSDPGVDSLTGEKWKGDQRPKARPATGPVWAKDGAFLVIRRLRQDVGGFHEFLRTEAERLNIPGPEADHRLGSRLVGRWKSGAPVMRADQRDNPVLADDDCANNHFEFQEASDPINRPSVGPDCSTPESFCEDNTHPQSPGDKDGAICPFAGHIRKTYPRDDTGTLAREINEVSTQTHRLLRRGIPFGDPFYPAKNPERKRDSGNRGLVFAAYQTSIEDQFEFVQKAWANNVDFKDRREGDVIVSGHDLIIGQTNDGQGEGSNGHRERRCRVTVRDKDGNLRDEIVVAKTDWVIPTGGGYFFSPSIDALCLLANRKREKF